MTGPLANDQASENGRDMAFPALDTSYTPNGTIQCGLTKRELFAAMAMQGLIPTLPTIKSNDGAPVTEAVIAEQAVIFADALLTALQEVK